MTSRSIRTGASPSWRPVSYGVGFWIAAAAFLVVMAFNTVPTPLWSIYEVRDGFSTFGVSVAFAAFAVGVLLSLFLAGHLGDVLGRRRILLPAIGLEIVAGATFLGWHQLLGLVVARLVAGLGAGMLTPTITAHIVDLHLKARPGDAATRGQIVAGVANLGGFGIGALASGFLASWAPAPLVTPFIVFIALLLVVFVGIVLVPETAIRPAIRLRYRPQRMIVPRESRGSFFLAGGIAFAAFAVLGLFTSLTPVFLLGQLQINSYAITGETVFATFAAAALTQIAVRRLGLPIQIILGAVIQTTGIALVAVTIGAVPALGLFFLGGVLGGGGAGVLFKAALALAGSFAPSANRGEVLAGIFLFAYMGLTVPVLGIGILTSWFSVATAMTCFAVFIIIVTVGTSSSLVIALRIAARRY